jgi:hypothetical protein
MITLDDVIGQVQESIEDHERGGDAPFSPSLLKTILTELHKMRASADFRPAYPRFVMDWPDAASGLGTNLMSIADYRYRALKGGR